MRIYMLIASSVVLYWGQLTLADALPAGWPNSQTIIVDDPGSGEVTLTYNVDESAWQGGGSDWTMSIGMNDGAVEFNNPAGFFAGAFDISGTGILSNFQFHEGDGAFASGATVSVPEGSSGIAIPFLLLMLARVRSTRQAHYACAPQACLLALQQS